MAHRRIPGHRLLFLPRDDRIKADATEVMIVAEIPFSGRAIAITVMQDNDTKCDSGPMQIITGCIIPADGSEGAVFT